MLIGDRVNIRFLVAILLSALAVGCAVPSIKSYADNVLENGATLEQMKARASNNPRIAAVDWSVPSYRLPNGNPVYIEMSHPKGCWYHWEVDKQERIVGWRVQGKRYWCNGLIEQGKDFSRWYRLSAGAPAG